MLTGALFSASPAGRPGPHFGARSGPKSAPPFPQKRGAQVPLAPGPYTYAFVGGLAGLVLFWSSKRGPPSHPVLALKRVDETTPGNRGYRV